MVMVAANGEEKHMKKKGKGRTRLARGVQAAVREGRWAGSQVKSVGKKRKTGRGKRVSAQGKKGN